MKPRLVLVQLPVPQPAALSSSGNVPLAAGALGVAARRSGLDTRLDIDVLPPDVTDRLGDVLLADLIVSKRPTFVGWSLYLWNSERSLHIASLVKARLPAVRIVVGGPEVASDNTWVIEHPAVDIAVGGEAEETFLALFDRLLDGVSIEHLPGVAVRTERGPGTLTEPAPPDFPLARFPSPYVEGVIPVDPARSTYVETVRGCRSHCTFCFYPRSSANLRSLPLEDVRTLVEGLARRGAREVVFLDPTFNHRPGFEELLETLKAANRDRALDFFGEVRAEGLTDAHARALHEAGFGRVEIGLQSVSDHTLKLTKRHGSAKLVAEAAERLKRNGVKLLVDLIVGLPGDTPEDVRAGFDFLQHRGLGDDAQVFLLSLLPGTSMRADAASLGIVFDPRPPYRVVATPTMDAATMAALLAEAEDLLGRRLDEAPRPHLSDPARDGPRDVVRIDLDVVDPDAAEALASVPMARHAALWISARDLWRRRTTIDRLIDARIAIDPCCTLDVVLVPGGPVPLDLADRVRARLDAAPPNYLSRVLEHRGENAQRRLAFVLPEDPAFPNDLAVALMETATVWRTCSLESAAAHASALGDGIPGARINGPVDLLSPAFRTLVREASPDAVAFADRDVEAHWTRDILGLAER